MTAVSGRLLTFPSLTISWATKGTRLVGYETRLDRVWIEIAAALPAGLVIEDHWNVNGSPSTS
jgi:hypothetical protein